MIRVLALIAILSACLLLFGATFDRGTERLGVSTRTAPTLMTVIVTFNHVTEAYRWLSVYGCSAQVTDTGSFCTGDFERESTIELYGHKQELIDWRNLPGGTMRVTAMAFDVNQKLLASGEVTVFRGQ